MIPVLYPSTETSFTTNGIGGLPDAISCVVTEQRNTQGGYWLEMDYPIDGLHYADIAPERIIYAAPFMGATPQPFRISRINRPINGIVHIEAPHISAQLQKITTSGTFTARSFTGITYDYAEAARDFGQTFPFWFSSDKTFTETQISFPEPTPFMDVLLGAEGSILDTFGGEYEWNGREVVLHDSRGVDSGLEIRYGVNMSDIEAETDAAELVTAVIPFWKGTVNDADVVVMGDMCTADNASAYAYVRCVPLDVTQQFELEQDEQPTAAQVTAKGQAFINSTGRKQLQMSIRVSYEPTTSGIGERRINLCDTVRVVYPDLGVSSISKVVETRFNVLTEQYDELTIGSIRNNIVDTIAGLISGGAITGGGGSSGGGGGSTAVTSVNGKTGAVVLNATDVGAMPSTYTAPVTSVNGMTGDVVVSGGGGAVDSVNGQTGVVVLTANDVGAVAAESGKGLSTNDFTTAEKTKLSGIATGAEVNVQADWNQTDSSADDFIKNKPTNMLPSYTSNDAWKKLRVNYNGSALEWAAESGIFYINESTLALDNGAKGSDITQALLSDFKSVYIVGNESYSDGVKFHIYLPLVDDAPTRDVESVSFYRPSANGIVVLNILAGQSVATKTVIPFGGSGSGNFVKITYNSNTAAVTHNGTAITGAQIKTLLDQQDAGAIMVDTNGDPDAVYKLKYIYSNGDVEFEGEFDDNIMNVLVASADSIGTLTITRKPQVYYYTDGTTVKSAVTNYAVTGQQIQNATIANGLAPIIYKLESSDYTTYEYHFFASHSGGLIFRTLDGKKQIFVGYNTSTATITQAAGWAANVLFYLDGTTVKYSGTNTAVTGSDVNAITIAVGIMPVIRQTINGIDYYFYFRIAHSGGLEFRLLDGTKDLSLSYNSSTATVTINYYAVTLNADGTVNTFDSALTYSAASSSVLNGTSKKLIVTWGNSIFTAEANEKLSGANGDIKFITDVEHDGIQRHMIFTLTSANALQTTLIETYARVPATVWEVADVTQGLIALNTNISSSLAWQLTGLNLAPFKRIKIYVKAGRKTGSLSADSSITPASIIEMSMDNRAKEDVSQNVFIGSSVVQNPNDPNRLGVITCAVSGDKTKFAVVRATTLYGTAATSNTDAYPYVFKIEGYYD